MKTFACVKNTAAIIAESPLLDHIVSSPESDMDHFVVLNDYVPDVLLDVRYYSTFNFVGERIDGYHEPIVLLTESAAVALKEVSDNVMGQGYRLKIYDGYRPQSAVDHFKRWASDLQDERMKSIFYPEVEKSMLFQLGYIAEKSSHSRGSSVDLTLFSEETGKDVDMGSPFDYFGERSHPNCSDGISALQYENRLILREAMTCSGFLPLETEWWHFTLKNEPFPNTYFNFPVSTASLPVL